MTHVRRRLAFTVALFVALATGGRDVGAQSCTPEKNAPKVIFVGVATGGADQDIADMLAHRFFTDLFHGAPEVAWFDLSSQARVLQHDATLLQAGGTVNFDELAGGFGSPFLFQLEFKKIVSRVLDSFGDVSFKTVYVVNGKLIDTRDATVVRGLERQLSIDSGSALLPVIDALAAQASANLLCDLLGRRERPAVPEITVEVTPHNVSPGGTVHVKATLTDKSTEQVQPNRDVLIENKHGSTVLSSLPYTTSFFGVVEQDLNVGSKPGDGKITATYTGSAGRPKKSNPESLTYRVLNTTGDVTIYSPDAQVRVGAGETVTGRHIMPDGAPVVGGMLGFAVAGGGGVSLASVVTDANGDATTQYTAPSTNAVVDVTASAPAPRRTPKTGAPAELKATLTFVVDAGVTLNLNALDTIAGATSDVTADLVVGGTAIPGSDVTFTLSGAGALTAASAPTDAAGRAEVTWVAPDGNSSATITATAVVDGQNYTKSVTVHARPIADHVSVKVVPGWANLTALALKTIVSCQARGDDDGPCRTVYMTLVGVQSCSSSPDYGAAAADVPVTLRADVTDWGGNWSEMSVTKPDPNVVVVDDKAHIIGYDGDMQAYACLELTFDAAGVLSVETTEPSPMGSYVFPRIYRPKTGATFTNVLYDFFADNFAGPDKLAYDPSSSVGSSEQIDIAQPETLQLVVALGNNTSGGDVPDGRFKFTFTFRKR